MDIFVRGIPDATTRLDLLRFVSSALKPKWSQLQFAPLGEIKACEIFQINNQDNGLEEFHGLVRIEPASAALAAIERLNGECINSKQVLVRKFYHRATGQNRRDERETANAPVMMEKRDIDRRRPHLVLQNLHSGATHAHTHQILETMDTSVIQ